MAAFALGKAYFSSVLEAAVISGTSDPRLMKRPGTNSPLYVIPEQILVVTASGYCGLLFFAPFGAL
jgi:hypothetical protein